MTGKVAAELRAVTSTSMPAQLLRPATSNHPFITHAARVAACGVLLGERAVERSEERLNKHDRVSGHLSVENPISLAP